MNFAISNIAWNPNENQDVYILMQKYWFTGLEVAPKKVFHDFRQVSSKWRDEFLENLAYFHISPIAMQSLLFGEEWLLLFQQEGRGRLLSYLWELIAFWAPMGIRSFVFWSPKNRIYENMTYQEACDIAIGFFRDLGAICEQYDVCVCIEPNPIIYWWNFLTWTEETMNFVKDIDHKNIKIHLDLGTIIYNEENINIISEAMGLFTHFHISEPGLDVIQKRDIHKQLKWLLTGFSGFVSIEMKTTTLRDIENSMRYISSIF